MFNRCIFIGHLTRDPELKTFASGAVCKFTLAMNHRTKNKEGVQQEEVCFVDVNAWGKQAEFVSQYFRKGKEILVEGRLKLDTWTKDGVEHSKHVIQAEKVSFVGSKDEKPNHSEPANAGFTGSDAVTLDDLFL